MTVRVEWVRRPGRHAAHVRVDGELMCWAAKAMHEKLVLCEKPPFGKVCKLCSCWQSPPNLPGKYNAS